MTKEELLAEEHICNGKCQDDITKNYVHCKTCTRLKDFLAGYKVGKAELENKIADIKANCDLAIEGRDVKVMELEKENKILTQNLEDTEIINKTLGERCNQLLADKGKLTDELDKWKAEWNDQVIKANEEGFARTLQTMQLTKAKKILQKVITDFHNMDCVSVHIDKTIAEAEQFLNSEVEK